MDKIKIILLNNKKNIEIKIERRLLKDQKNIEIIIKKNNGNQQSL
jgi:hypothetical protein